MDIRGEDVWLAGDGAPLHVRILTPEEPKGAVVFVHGLGCSAATYETLVPRANFLGALAAHGLAVHAPDLPGHGRSGGRRGHLLYRDAMAAIAETVAYAAARYERVTIAGSSLGGVLALYAAVEDERVVAVACHNAAGLRDVRPLAVALRHRALLQSGDALRALAARAPHLPVPSVAFLRDVDVFFDPERRRRWREAASSRRRYTLSSLVSLFLTPEDKPAVEALGKPALIVTGSEDRVFPLSAQRAVAQRIGAAMTVVPGAAHMLPLEHLPAAASIMGEWLATRMPVTGSKPGTRPGSARTKTAGS